MKELHKTSLCSKWKCVYVHLTNWRNVMKRKGVGLGWSFRSCFYDQESVVNLRQWRKSIRILRKTVLLHNKVMREECGFYVFCPHLRCVPDLRVAESRLSYLLVFSGISVFLCPTVSCLNKNIVWILYVLDYLNESIKFPRWERVRDLSIYDPTIQWR